MTTQTMRHVDPASIAVGGTIGQRIERTWRGNLLQLDWEGDFLQPFIDQSHTVEYVGLGKTLDALVRFAYHTHNDELNSRRRRVIDSLLALQESDGYLGTHPPVQRVKELWDVHECSYLVLGLTSNWRWFGESPSLEAAVRLADYMIQRLSPDMVAHGWKHSVLLDSCGLDRALLTLYAATNEKKLLEFVVEKQKLLEWSLPIIEGRHGPIEGHAYAYMLRCLAQLELYDFINDDRLLAQSRRALDYLCHRGGMFITGSAGRNECWCHDQGGEGELGETCATAYFIRWFDKLLRREGDARYGSMMERSILNALFAAQSGDGRHLRYYSPFVGPRTFWHLDTYCCPGNFRRIIAELPNMIYYQHGGGIAVNLFTPSSLQTTLPSGIAVKLTQETRYPIDGRVRLRMSLSKPGQFPLRLRKPAFDRSGAQTDERGWLVFDRLWSQEEIIDVSFNVSPRLVSGFERQAGKAAVMCGPQLFAFNTSRYATVTKDASVAVDPSAQPIAQPQRPGGLALAVRLGDRDVTLTEFPDPDNTAAYFAPALPKQDVADELFGC